jgi:hypothetical protein
MRCFPSLLQQVKRTELGHAYACMQKQDGMDLRMHLARPGSEYGIEEYIDKYACMHVGKVLLL